MGRDREEGKRAVQCICVSVKSGQNVTVGVEKLLFAVPHLLELCHGVSALTTEQSISLWHAVRAENFFCWCIVAPYVH